MRIEKMALSELLGMAHQKNPKDHDIESLVASFKRFGFTAAPTVDEASATMVAGHGRCEALELMRSTGQPPPSGVDDVGTNEWMVPVVRGVAFASERERDAYVIADNQNVMAGGWKFDVLSELIAELKTDGGFDGLGFSTIELDALLGQAAAELPDDGFDPEDGTSNAPDSRPTTTMVVTVECPSCGHKFER
jgi:hypothetical protein